MRTLTDVFVPGAPTLPEGLRTLAVSPERELEPGMTVRASFTFRNQGGAPASGVRVRFNLPEGLVYLVGSGLIDGESADDEQGSSPLLSRSGAHIGDVEPGAERRIDMAYSVAGAIENGSMVELQAAVAAFEVPPVGSNIVRLIARSRPALANALSNVAIESRQQARPGGEATITVRVHNAGESSAHDVMVIAPIPDHTSYIPNSVRVNGRDFERELLAAFDRVHAPIIVPSLPASATATLQYRVRIDDPLEDGTILVAHAHVASQETAAFGLEPAGLTVRAQPQFMDERTSFTVEPEGHVVPGSRVMLRLVARNTGTTSAENVSVTLVLPEQLISVRGAFRVDGKPMRERKKSTAAKASLTFDLGRIAAREAVEFSGEATVTSPIADGKTLPIEAILRWSYGSEETAAYERRFEHGVSVRSQPYFSPRHNRIVRAGDATRSPSDECEAVIEIANDGSADATATRLAIVSDSALEDIRVFDGTTRLDEEIGVIDLATIEPYSSRLLTVRGRIRTPYQDRAQIRIAATLDCAELGAVALGEAVWRIDSHPVFSAQSSSLVLKADDVFRPNQLVEIELTLHNEGTDTATNLRLRLYISPEAKLESVEGATRDRTTLLFGDIPAGGRAEARLGVRLLRGLAKAHPVTVEGVLTADAMLPVQLAPLTIVTTAEPNFSVGTLRSEPADVANSGDEVEFVLHIRNGGDGPARFVKVHADSLDTLIYVPNSTQVNGLVVRDVGTQSPICSEAGIVLSDVDPGVEATLRWREVVHSGLNSGDVITRAATITYDGEKVDQIIAPELKVRASPVFANRIAGLPFGVDGVLGAAFGGPRALADPGERYLQLPPAQPIVPEVEFSTISISSGNGEAFHDEPGPQQIQTVVAFDRVRLDRALKFLSEARFSGLVTHLFALRAFLPDAAGVNAERPLDQVRASLRETLDRLFIKLRLPNYVMAPRDLEAPSWRADILELLDSVEPGTPPEYGGIVLVGTIDLLELRLVRDRVDKTVIGTAPPWAAIARFLPNADEGWAHYQRLLVSSLDDLSALPQDAFVDALQRRPYPVLDTALEIVLTQLTVRS